MVPIDAVLRALDLYSAELKKQSQTLQPTKTVIYHPSTPTANGTETVERSLQLPSDGFVVGFLRVVQLYFFCIAGDA